MSTTDDLNKMSFTEAIRAWLLAPLTLQLKQMEDKIMSQLDDLNVAIQAEDVDIQQLGPIATKIDADIVALKAAVAAGATPTDLTTQITAIQAHTAALATGLSQLSASDTKANPAA